MATNTTDLARNTRLDVTADLTLASGWVQVKGLVSFKPSINPNMVDTTSYDTNGWSAKEVTLNEWDASVTFWRRAPSGVYDVGQEMIRARQGQFGDSARIGLRWYNIAGLPDAWQGVGIVEWDRATDGVKDPAQSTAKFSSDGILTPITNPFTPGVAPTILSATPSGAAAGALITLTGTSFTGLTALTISGVACPTRIVESDQMVVFVVPAGSAGSAPIIATNATGASTAFAYTRT